MRTINDVLPTMEPDHQTSIRRMLEDADVSADILVDRFLTIYAFGTERYKNLNLEEVKALIPLMSCDRTKFAPKLTFHQRCEILAMHHAGISRELLAKAYNIDRRTVTHIYNSTSEHYRDVRRQQLELGQAAFQKKYLTQDVLDKVLAQRQLRETAVQANNKSANKKAGPHTVQGEMCDYPHRVVIAWKDKGDPSNMNGETISVSGWYYNDLDGGFPNQWYWVDEESTKTSDNCYRAMLKDISDKL